MVVDVCENPYVLNVILFVEQIIKVIYYIIPLGLIVFMMIDFFKGIISQEDKGSREFVFSLKRIINLVALFLVPTFVSFFTQFLSDLEIFNGDYAACLKNTNNVTYYQEKYLALEKEEEDKRNEEQEKKLTEYEYYKKLNDKKKLNVVSSGNSNTNNTTNVSSVTVGQTYNLSDDQIRKLTAVCIGEQGAYKDGVATEASVMANIYEEQGSRYSSVYDFVYNSGWFSSQTTDNHALNRVTDELFNSVKDVLVNGQRTIPLYVNDHDCWFCANHKGKRCYNGNKGDICYLNNGGSNLSSKSEIKNRDNYTRDKTKIYTYYKQSNSGESTKYFIFYDWARPSTKGGDPFGYTEANYKRING